MRPESSPLMLSYPPAAAIGLLQGVTEMYDWPRFTTARRASSDSCRRPHCSPASAAPG